jgi:hypothetical protein
MTATQIPSIEGRDAIPSAVGPALANVGCIVLRGVFAAGWIARVLDHDSPAIAGALAEPELLAHPQVAPILASVLGDGYIMGRLALGTDGVPARTSLFGASSDLRVPAIGLSLHIALTQGAVRAVPGSHRDSDARSTSTLELAAGDCVLADTRLVLEPAGGRMLLSVYYRHWFREPVAPLEAPPLSISLLTYRRLPPSQRHLFAWRFDRYAHLRPRLLLDRGLRRLPGALQDLLSRRR